MLHERAKEELGYRVVDEKEDPSQSVIQKTGMVAEFTLNDINMDMQLLGKKKDELESQMKIEEARMINIDRSNPEVGQMSEEMRQVIFIYARAFAFVKVAQDKLVEIDTQMKSYRDEMMQIAMQTGVALTPPTPKSDD